MLSVALLGDGKPSLVAFNRALVALNYTSAGGVGLKRGAGENKLLVVSQVAMTLYMGV